MTDLVIRPLTEDDAHLFHTLRVPALVGRGCLGHTYATVGQGGEYRPEWTWVALREERVVARAAWWAGPEDTAPIALDWFDFADGEADAAAELLRTAPLRTEYSLLTPPGWRDQPELRAAAQARIDAAVAGGLVPLVERYRYEWTPECGLPERPGRLEFRPEPDDAAIEDALRRIMPDTLDAHDRRAIARGGVDAAVRELMDILAWLPSPREWWRLAYTPGGELVGIQVPARNPGGPCVGYIGVVAEQRGHGYAYDLLVECTHDLVEQGATKIAAATDQPNLPMAAHFARAGYPVTQERIDLI
ncbi:N-acetyltransferase [Streptomyces antimycoticus]|uniref:N-acetyltransferase n=3 Tax=Streptomyces TaxID=1883 RepID=A0ABD5J549_9ACTN|nr:MULTISPECIES: N-acetyltransferase [Streptomyces]MEE4583468.1 N-acetyltransferase [Streptomyces sp. DSM 41602]AJZ83126.1 N-acetyltransferase [Streptomyces sp. AgN23]KUL67347.1 GCN5 family acetyltransferase [Streptomyces violaceusniger]RSS37337.1 N-acetyltransferase [Streptomyces sp. WAC05858]WJD96633.1 N-acetyltransferase [Streptomyces antimycoticus]